MCPDSRSLEARIQFTRQLTTDSLHISNIRPLWGRAIPRTRFPTGTIVPELLRATCESHPVRANPGCATDEHSELQQRPSFARFQAQYHNPTGSASSSRHASRAPHLADRLFATASGSNPSALRWVICVMKPTEYHGSHIELHLWGSDEGGWVAQCIVIGPTGEPVTMEPTAAFHTKEPAGQSGFDAACEHIDVLRKKRSKRS